MVKLEEREPETTFVKTIYLEVTLPNGATRRIYPTAPLPLNPLAEGQSVEIHFDLAPKLAKSSCQLHVAGFYTRKHRIHFAQ